MTTHEQDIRVQLLNTFLTTPHRKLAELAPIHTDALGQDPLFYGHLAPWYFAKGEVRDHRTLFVAHLATCDFPEFREAAWMLLQQLAPFEVVRVLDHSKRVIGKTPRSLRSAIRHYLHTREKNEKQFDGAALRAHDALKHLYASLRIKPGPRAQAILFDEKPPEDSPLAALKRLAKAESAEEQATILLEHHIPYTTAIGAVKHLTPAVLVAIINTMTPQEVINNLAALKRRGATNDAEVKSLIEQKIAEAATDTRVSTMKTGKARQVAQVDETLEQRLKEVTNQRVASKVEIKRPTALFVDKSGSMARAIELAKQLAALVSAVIQAEFHVYAFDSAAFEIQTQGKEHTALSDWEEAFKFVKANGATSLGVALAKMTRERVYAEQLVIVTDEGENTAPLLVDAWDEYRKNMNTTPSVIIIQVEGVNERFAAELQRRGVEVIRYQFRGDTYSLPNILPLLAMPSRAELVEMIMQYELPKRPKPGGQTA